jgi:mono/diheme cytochrome c family protein
MDGTGVSPLEMNISTRHRRPWSTVLTVVAFLTTVGLTAQSARTVWDGVYTDEQAERGRVLFADRCARCHGDSLTGVEAAPALTGTAFYSNWEGERLEALFDRMRMSMPQDKPGSLSRAQNADILALSLKVGGYPAGPAALDGQPGALVQTTIRMYKP